MSDHEKINLLLPFYLAGSLDEQQAAVVKAHLEVCSLCAEDLGFWQEVEGALKAEVVPVYASRSVLDASLSAIRRREERPNPLVRAWQIILAHVPIFSKDIWPASLLVLLLGFVVTLLSDRAGFLFVIAPLVSVAGLAFIYNKSSDPVLELVFSTPVSQVQLLMACVGLVFGFNLVVVSLLGLGLSFHFSIDVILPLLQGWLAPMTFLSAFGLCLSIFLKASNAIFMTYALWLTQFLPLTELFKEVFGHLAESFLWFWQSTSLLYLLSFGLLVFMVFWLLKGTHFSRRLA